MKKKIGGSPVTRGGGVGGRMGKDRGRGGEVGGGGGEVKLSSLVTLPPPPLPLLLNRSIFCEIKIQLHDAATFIQPINLAIHNRQEDTH